MNGNATVRETVRRTSSLCPVCLKKTEAQLVRLQDRDGLWMMKSCPDHGAFFSRVWGDKFDHEKWTGREEPLTEAQRASCDGNCRSCTGIHGQGTCCVILEVTKSCNLSCPYCFARGGESDDLPAFDDLCRAIADIAVKGGGPLIQLSGGEPTIRDDLPELVKYVHEAGCRYAQINTNGIRLAWDEEYVKKLADAGLDIVFMQYDGNDDEIYRKLRGRDLLDTKLKAIENCDRYGIGVTLVPTVVRGINDHELGSIVRKAAELFPAVRAVHFQPVTYLGRYPSGSLESECSRYTLDELMAGLCEQTGIPEAALLPSRCDHAACEFHSTFLVSRTRQLIPMTDRAHDVRCERTPADRNREYVAEHWRRDRAAAAGKGYAAHDFCEFDPGLPLITADKEEMEFDEFVRRMKTDTLKISAMAFQDAMDIDLERLYRCSLHVYEDGRLLPFCSKYMTPIGCPVKGGL